jgi:hypothetical protein
MWWLANEDPVRLKEFEKMDILGYMFLLDKKIGDILKENAVNSGHGRHHAAGSR